MKRTVILYNLFNFLSRKRIAGRKRMLRRLGSGIIIKTDKFYLKFMYKKKKVARKKQQKKAGKKITSLRYR